MSAGDNSQISAASIQQPRLLRFELPNIHAHELAAERAQVPALGRLLAIEERVLSKPAHILELELRQRPLDRQPQAAPNPANASPD